MVATEKCLLLSSPVCGPFGMIAAYSLVSPTRTSVASLEFHCAARIDRRFTRLKLCTDTSLIGVIPAVAVGVAILIAATYQLVAAPTPISLQSEDSRQRPFPLYPNDRSKLSQLRQ